MKITRQRLKQIIKEETYKVLTKDQDQARKDAKSRSLERSLALTHNYGMVAIFMQPLLKKIIGSEKVTSKKCETYL